MLEVMASARCEIRLDLERKHFAVFPHEVGKDSRVVAGTGSNAYNGFADPGRTFCICSSEHGNIPSRA